MNSPFVTIQLVRDELMDRFPGDNSIDCDLAFSDEEILHAMERAAAAYNSVPPFGVGRVAARCMPAQGTNLFLDATISRLLGAAIHKLSRNQLSYSAGGVTVELEKTRMINYQQLKKELDEQWRVEARERKAEMNRMQAWCSY